MPVSEQAREAAAEGVAGSTQHIDSSVHASAEQRQQQATTEQLDSLGPWPLRRGSTSNWTVISSPGARARGGTNSSLIGSPGTRINPNTNNPFSDAFAASLDANTLFRDGNQSEASGSTAVTSSVDTAAQEKSEFTQTMEQVDRQCESIRHILNGDAIAPRNDEAERRRYVRQRKQSAANPPESAREQQPQNPASGHVQWQTAEARPRPRDPASRDIEREAAGAFHQLEAVDCQTCQQNAAIASAGLCMLIFTAVIDITSPFIFRHYFWEESSYFSAMLKQNHNTKLFLILMAIPFASFGGMLILTTIVLTALWSPRRQLKSGKQFFRLWLCLLVLAVAIYFVITGLIYKFSK